jgi:hypothetical protein
MQIITVTVASTCLSYANHHFKNFTYMNLSNLQHQSCEVATGEETDTESLASG